MATPKQKAKDLQKILKKQVNETGAQLDQNLHAQQKASSGTAQTLLENQAEQLQADRVIMQALDLLLGKI